MTPACTQIPAPSSPSPTTTAQDGRAYIGGFEGYRGRKGLGFTVTKLGKGLIANREGPKQIGVGLIIDFTAQSYKRTSAAGEEEAEVSMAGAAATSTGAAAVPDFWDEAGVYALLRSVVEDPSGHWAAMVKFTEALRAEQAKLLHEEAPAVPIQAYARERECDCV